MNKVNKTAVSLLFETLSAGVYITYTQGRKPLSSMKTSKLLLLLALYLAAHMNILQAQLIITPGGNINNLASRLVGQGVILQNVTMQCPSNAYGWFVDPTGTLGIDSGIILTSGSATNAAGPNSSPSTTTSNGAPGDPDLNALIFPNTTNDACVLELDIIPLGDTIRFDYVFGSEEYPEWVNFSYNDVFAFWISGPGIPVPTNIALIPGTNTPVSINNVNMGNYNCPGPPTGCTNCAFYRDNCAGTIAGEYDGYTTVLTAVAQVTPCQTYHLKLAIADAGDFAYDSGVFIAARSIQSKPFNVNYVTSIGGGTGFDTLRIIYENNCFDPYVVVSWKNPAPYPLTVHISTGGQATLNVDYTISHDSIVFTQVDTVDSILITPIPDNIPEGPETLVIYFYIQCAGTATVLDSITLILDEFDISAQAPQKICPFWQDTAHLSVSGAPFVVWSPSNLVDCDTCPSTFLSVSSPPDTTYTLLVTGYVDTTLSQCTDTDTISIYIAPYFDPMLSDTQICLGDTIQLQHAVDSQVIQAILWQPSTGLSCDNCPYPYAYPDVSTQYTLFFIDTNGCRVYDTLFIWVYPPPRLTVSPFDTTICRGDTAIFTISGQDMDSLYIIPDNIGVINIDSHVVLLSPPLTQQYTIIAQGSPVCPNDTQFITVFVDTGAHITLSPYPDTIIYFGTTIDIQAYTNADSFLWLNPYIEDSTSIFTSFNYTGPPKDTVITVYFLTYTSNGCFKLDSILIRIIPVRCEEADFFIPTAFTPNGDGNNDIFYIYTGGAEVEIVNWSIYDRWGNKVFEWAGRVPAGALHTPEGWDGTVNGRPARPDVYVWVLQYKCPYASTVITLHGDVTLLK